MRVGEVNLPLWYVLLLKSVDTRKRLMVVIGLRTKSSGAGTITTPNEGRENSSSQSHRFG
jgi:hypothetical protein